MKISHFEGVLKIAPPGTQASKDTPVPNGLKVMIYAYKLKVQFLGVGLNIMAGNLKGGLKLRLETLKFFWLAFGWPFTRKKIPPAVICRYIGAGLPSTVHFFYVHGNHSLNR